MIYKILKIVFQIWYISLTFSFQYFLTLKIFLIPIIILSKPISYTFPYWSTNTHINQECIIFKKFIWYFRKIMKG
nr:MAG TPA: hypothetical protein [Caudoviricetes sp.]